MNRKLRYAGLVAGLAIVAAACTPGSSTAPSSEPAAPSATTATGESPAPAGLTGNLTVWETYGSSGGNAEFAAFTQALDAVQAANPGLTVSYVEVPFGQVFDKFKLEAPNGSPDMFIAPNDSLGDLIRGGFISDLTGKIDDTLANTNQVSIDGMSLDGKIYGVPESMKAVAMYYDTAKIPTAPATTADLLAAVKGGAKVGIIAPDGYFGWGLYKAFGGEIFDANGKCAATANSGVADAMAFVKEMKDAGALVDPTYATVNDAFKSGQIDAILNGNWTL
ncbi:MAG: extracellular solute-binding protein, partial [Candidatus Limnocylindrales bacterium]